jgi:Ca2+-binding RTX toxin-like protein
LEKNMAEYIGTTGNDIHVGTAQPDTINGGDGNDTLSGGNQNDIINGDAGDDKLFGDNGQDTLTGGAGNDQLTGGTGTDTFVFNFTVSSSGSWVTQVATFRDGTAPAQTADAVAWNNYLKQLEAWRAEMLATTGELDEDTNLDGTAILTTSTKKAGTITVGEVAFDNDYQWQEWVETTKATIEGEGYDTILDWSDGAPDKLLLNGLSNVATDDNYWGKFLTTDAAVDGKTVISFDGGSITLVGVDTSMADLIAAGLVDFGVTV